MRDFRQVVRPIPGVGPETAGRIIYDRFSGEPDTLIIPVLDADAKPIGLVERNAFFLRMAAEYGRALYGGRPISALMDPHPLVVEVSASLEAFTGQSLSDRPSDLLHGFIVTDGGRYLGVATAIELLQMAHERSRRHLEALEDATGELARAKADAEAAQAFMTTVVENIPAMVFVKAAADRRFLLLNRVGEEILGCDRREVLGRTGDEFYPPDLAQAYADQDDHVLTSGEALLAEDERLVRKDGQRVVLRTKKLVVRDGGGRPQYLLGIAEDITQQRLAERQIAHLAHYDALTDLPNRVSFRRELHDALARARRSGEQVAVLCVDLDHFKTVNDTLGHPVGDALLQAAGERLRQCVRDGDVVARLGGDEFAIVQCGADLPAGAGVLAARIVEAIAEPFLVMGHQVVIGASVGVAVAPDDAAEPDELLKKSDMALYRVKSEGRGGFHFFERAMDERLQARRSLELALRKAVVAGEFELHFQPLMTLETGRTGCCEALLRWRSPERGLVSPADFIPLAEEIGLIVPMGEWVLREACAQAMRWPGEVRVAVNISPAQFRSRGLLGTVISALAASGLSADRLELEITESVLLQDNAANLETLHSLRDLGVRISMDDFGTGYSSLSYLRSFPFDKIKIDQSFVRDLPRDADALAIIQAVTGLGANLGMSTTAEGVETQAQMDELRRQGCDEIQGFLISRPIGADQIAAFLGAAPEAAVMPIEVARRDLPQAAASSNCSLARRA